MGKKALRSADETNDVFLKYSDMLYGICILQLKNKNDAEDAVSETIIKYMCSSPEFESEEHRKAWLIRVAINHCHDMQRKMKRYDLHEISDISHSDSYNDESGIIDFMMSLDEKFSSVLYLYYVEQYSVKEISQILGKGQSAIKMRLKKGRELLKEGRIHYE